MSDRGRVIVNTGDGKGKTTAALGTAFRALGHGQRVCVIQFLKGQGRYGERMMAEKIDNLDWHICGKGFVFNREDIEADRAVAREGFDLAKKIFTENRHDLVILDEIILTGRDAPQELVDIADTVSEIKAVKHAYERGIKAQKGVEY